MLKVLPVQSKDEQRELCSRCGVEYNADLLAYAAYSDGKFAGISQFKLTDKGGLVYDIAPCTDFYDFESLFVMGRGTLNFIDLAGVHYAIYAGEVKDETLLKAIGFKKTETGSFEINLEGFFTDHCGNHK